jgi:hypothetical protein
MDREIPAVLKSFKLFFHTIAADTAPSTVS